MDGDKIAALAASFVQEQLAALESELSFAAVQTAYANGAATAHMRAHGVPVVIVRFATLSAAQTQAGPPPFTTLSACSFCVCFGLVLVLFHANGGAKQPLPV
jgi:hypothetical protein